MSEDRYTYEIQYGSFSMKYKVLVYKNGREIDWHFAMTKWGARQQARRTVRKHRSGRVGKTVEKDVL